MCFNWMPITALVNEKILCMHGGLSPDLTLISDIYSIKRPSDVPDKGMLCDLLWSDPDDQIYNWGSNDRGVSYTFGQSVLQKFIDKNNLDLVCRAH